MPVPQQRTAERQTPFAPEKSTRSSAGHTHARGGPAPFCQSTNFTVFCVEEKRTMSSGPFAGYNLPPGTEAKNRQIKRYHLVSAVSEGRRGGNRAFQWCHLYPRWMAGIKSVPSVKVCTRLGPWESLLLCVFDMQRTESMGIVEDVIFQISYSDSLISHFHNETLPNRPIFITKLCLIGISPLFSFFQ